MIRPPGFTGAAFGAAADGNGRDDPAARRSISRELGIPARWAWLRQVHGTAVVEALRPGLQGDADAVFTAGPGLPLAIATADCVPVVLEADGCVGVAHAGWKGVAAGVVEALRAAMESAGRPPVRAAIGPAVGPCCYEVGPEVASLFPAGRVGRTSAGTTGVHLAGAVADVLADLEVWSADLCTNCEPGFHSYRGTGTRARQVAVGWVPHD